MIELKGALYRWEIGRTVTGFTGNVAQFSNAGDSLAMAIKVEDGSPVRIPDRYLATGKPVVVCDVETGLDGEETVISVKVFPVKDRAKPKNYTPTQAEEAYGEVKALSEAAKAAAEAADEYMRRAEDAADTAGGYAEDASVSAQEAKEAVKDLVPLVIDTSLDFGESPVKASEIYQAAQSGREVILTLSDDEEVRAYLSAAYPDRAVFTANGHNPHTNSVAPTFYIVSDDGVSAIYAADIDAVLALIARGGTGNISMGDKRWIRAGSVAAPVFQVDSNEDDGFFLRAGEYEEVNAVAKFSDTVDDMHPVILRNVAPGTKDLDAVNKGQLDAAIGTRAKIDDENVGADSWSSKNIVERLCPSFEKEGLLVQCESVEGYPVAISFESSGETPDHMLTVCGKNLYDKAAYPLDTVGYPYKNIGNFSTSASYRRTGFINVAHLAGQTITVNYAPTTATNPGMAFYTRIPDTNNADDCKAAYCGGGSGYNTKVPDNAVYMCFCVAANNASKDVQLEIGSKATEFEMYSAEEHSITTEEDSAVVTLDPIIGKSGLATFYVYSGVLGEVAFIPEKPCVVQISGRADPRAEIRKLTENVEELKAAILAMGANV